MSRIDFIHPDCVIRKDYRTYLRFPQFAIRIAQTKSPAREWYQLKDQFPWLVPYLVKAQDVPLCVIEENMPPWTFEDELHAIETRGW